MSYVSWDIESTVHTRFKRKANPYIPENWTVTHGVKHKGDASVSEYRFGKQRPGPGWLKPVLYDAAGNRVKLVIGMNIKFDIQHALQDTDNLLMWMDFVAHGGRVWDIQLAEYLLNGQAIEHQMLSLDEIAPRYGGNVKFDEVKLLWQQGWMTEDIEPELLTRYLCGGVNERGEWDMGDVENTEKVALRQIALAHKRGQLESINLNMGALLYTVEAERNGMFVDTVDGLRMAAELRVKLEEMRVALQEYMPKDLPFEFSWGSRFHKSALIFGGTVRYDHYEYDLAAGGTILKKDYEQAVMLGDAPARVYANKKEEHYLLTDGTTMNVEDYDNLSFGMGNGDVKLADRETFKAGLKAGQYKTKQVTVPDMTKPKGRAVKATYTFQGYTKPEKQWESSDPGVYSTASDVITELGDRNVPFLKIMAALQKMAKDLGTYFIGEDAQGNPSGLLTLVGPDGLVHHMLNMVSTITARLSSSNPNLQNIPKGNKSDVKLLFKSRFGHWVVGDYGDMVWWSDGKIIQSDFSSLEVYIQAILSNCQQLIKDLAAGLDLHVVRLAAKEKMDYEEVLKLCKGYTTADGTKVPLVKEWDYKRTGAKVYSFQRAFGAGNAKIAASTGMTLEEVEALADAEDKRYPEIGKFYEGVTASINANRSPWKVVQHPTLNGVTCHLGQSFYVTPDGKRYTYKQLPAPDYQVKRDVTATFMPTEIKNYVVQGTGGEWAKAAMYLAVRAFYKRKNFNGLGLLVNQVHDATYADAHASVAFEVAALLHACMEAASDYMAWKFKWNIPLRVPSDTMWGSSMMEEKDIPGLTERAAVLRTELRKEYMDGYEHPSYLN